MGNNPSPSLLPPYPKKSELPRFSSKKKGSDSPFHTVTPPYGQPHLLHGLETHQSEMEMEVFAQYEFQFEVEGVSWGSGGIAEPSPP
nr:hypothetical protein [Tanacetum cinerariifolium]